MSEMLKPGRSATRHEPAAHAFQIRTHAYPADAAANTAVALLKASAAAGTAPLPWGPPPRVPARRGKRIRG